MTKSKLSKKLLAGRIAILLLLLLSAIFYVSSLYKRQNFGDAQIDEIIFYFLNGFGDGQSSSLVDAFINNIPFFIIILFLMLLPVIDFYRNRIIINVDLSFFGRKKGLKLNPSRIPLSFKLTYAIIIFLLSTNALLMSFDVANYIKATNDASRVFEESYVNPQNVKLTFPAKKRNLIFIYLESMENTLLSKANGGQLDKSLIPELEQIAMDPQNVSFSHQTTGLGGALPADGTTWTVGSMVAHSGGIPLKSHLFGIDRSNDYGEFSQFLPGAYTLGDILKSQGYNQVFIMGSDSAFGGRNKLLSQHGGYILHDYNYAKNNSLIDPDYHVWWGYEDKKMFEFTKKELDRLSRADKPFNLQLLTVDTHFTDGYLDPTCPTPHQNQYDNVYACSSKLVGEFLTWLKQQPFMKDTAVVLVGDHLGMQTSYYDEKIKSPHYQRTTYNVFINPAVTPIKTHERLFSALDFYPTTLSAMGVKIDGDRLALGVNLFTDQPTLVEKYGSVEALNQELTKRSTFYEKNILTKP